MPKGGGRLREGAVESEVRLKQSPETSVPEMSSELKSRRETVF
jgi:hypothetical protein